MQPEIHGKKRFPRRVCWQGAQRPDCAQGSIVKQAMAAALFDTGGSDLSSGVKDEIDENLPLKALGDCFCRVKITPLILLFELFAHFLLPVAGGR